MRSRITAVLASTFVCLLAFAASAQAAFPGADGKIAFADGLPCCASHIYTINPDGTGQTTLAHGGDPAWSADGRKIAYINSANHLATMDADGSGQTDLGVGPTIGGVNVYSDLGDPAWSPDGGQIAFAENVCYPDDTCTSFLWIVNADGSDRHRILPPSDDYGYSPAWSPDGQWIAFSGYCDYPSTDLLTICKAHPDGTGLTPVYSRSDGDSLAPDWSPDGTEIVFSVSYSGSYIGSIWKVRADGTGSGVVRAGGPDREAYHWEPAWSPDRTKIAFTSNTPITSPSAVYVMNSGGSDATRLTAGIKPSWQPIPNRPPDCSGVVASRPVLTAANHRLVPITLDGATDPDGDAVTLSVDGVTQDEPVVSRTDNTSPDAVNQGDGQLRVRAERNPHGDGRVYRIAFTASDGRGGSCSSTAKVSVPRKKHTAVDSAPPSYDSFAP